ncbi:MAG: 16S rRNA (guanine(966)-N(2))-methyltransferase RsmD [Granulosicoccus sp.]
MIVAGQHPNIVSPPSNRSRNPRQNKSTGQIRIIAGQWRGRKLPVPAVEGLRPTGDRVRETLFNWLQTDIAGSRCLDLFAGTGALGFEALSRYAKHVDFVEPHVLASAQIESSLVQLDHVGSVHQCTAQVFLASNNKTFDIIFIDPPFAMQCQEEILQLLCSGHASDGALVYMEAPSRQVFSENWPSGFEIRREKQFGDVTARLFELRKDADS